jgi:glycerate kinase
VARPRLHEGTGKIETVGDISVLIAPDSFKGSLSAQEAAAAMREGVREVFPRARVVSIPLSDGGEGLLSVLLPVPGGEINRAFVSGPIHGRQVEARWGYVERSRTAVIEMAEAAGLGLVPTGQRDPLVTTTFGVGELIRVALDRGAQTILVGIGGSATNDGGAGMAQALGVGLLDAAGNPLRPGGAALFDLASIDMSGLDPRLRETDIIVACDVRNPLTGPEGASVVFGPQKGASPADVVLLDAALAKYHDLIFDLLRVDVQLIPGSGAAGGLGAGLVVFCGAVLRSGIDLVLEQTGFDAALAGADLVLTGEGRLDDQTRFGKALSGVLRRAGEKSIPVAAVVGDVRGRREDFVGPGKYLDLIVLVDEHTTLEDAIENARFHVRRTTAELVGRLLPFLTTRIPHPHAS